MTAISTLLLAVFAFYALGSLGHAKRARHAQLIVDLTRRWDELLYREQMILVLTPRRLQALVRLVLERKRIVRSLLEFFDRRSPAVP